MEAQELKDKLWDTNIERDYEFSDEILEKAIAFTKKAHDGVYDKMGEPYYKHPFRVCQLVKERFGNDPLYTPKQINYACTLALLHDVVEDTNYRPEDITIELGLNPKESLNLETGLKYITHNKNVDPYSTYIKKIAEAHIIYPVWVKYCDLLDNSSLDRIIVSNDSIFLTGEDMNRINKYLISIRILRKRLNCQSGQFQCDMDEVNMINNFRTPAERKRMEKSNKE